MTKALNLLWVVGMLGLLAAAPDRLEAAAPNRHSVKSLLLAIPNLTSDQKNRIAHLTNTVRMQTAPLREQIAALRRDMARLWAGDPVDAHATSVKQSELLGVLAKMYTVWADFFAQLHDVLTPPQRAWLALRAPGLYGSDAGADLGIAPAKDCLCPEAQPSQYPGLLQEPPNGPRNER